MLTAGDFAPERALVTHLFGGFSHHVIHHLFQHICHIHYPALTKILIRVAAKHGVECRSEKHMFSGHVFSFQVAVQQRQPDEPRIGPAMKHAPSGACLQRPVPFAKEDVVKSWRRLVASAWAACSLACIVGVWSSFCRPGG